MRVLLSIKPEYVDKIFDGTKRFEFRKSVFKNTGIQTAVVYATQPVGQIVGEFDIEAILREEPCALWTETQHAAGIDIAFFDSYFEGRDHAVAIQIGETRLYENPINPRDLLDKFVAPQSYRYLEDDALMCVGEYCEHAIVGSQIRAN